MQALVRAPAPAPSVPAPPESPRQADEERNRERNRGYARAYRERKRLKLQTLENCRQELLKDNARLLEEAQARDRKEAALSAERDAARDRLARVEAENRALRAWIHQLNAPPAQMALKQPMMGMGVALVPRASRPRAPRRRPIRSTRQKQKQQKKKSRVPRIFSRGVRQRLINPVANAAAGRRPWAGDEPIDASRLRAREETADSVWMLRPPGSNC